MYDTQPPRKQILRHGNAKKNINKNPNISWFAVRIVFFDDITKIGP